MRSGQGRGHNHHRANKAHPNPAWGLAKRLAGMAQSASRLLVLACMAGALGSSAHAAEPPAEPMLRIETGTHLAQVNRVDVDAAGRWAVTVSHDKTARVWSVATGQLQQVLRPPIGPGNVGKLYAVAMSPDGQTVAVGGATPVDLVGGGLAVYLFDRSSGRLLQRLGGINNVINHLAFSPDGRWLAATLFGGSGLRVWDWRSGNAPLANTGCTSDGYGAAWSADNRLATSCYDGRVRLFKVAAGKLEPLADAATTGGSKPYGLSFHPDGSRLAVGYGDSRNVDVLDGHNLNMLYRPDASGVANGNLGRVAFSRDGRVLAAAGQWYTDDERYPVRLWPEAGRGRPRDVPTAGTLVTQLAALPGNGFVVGAAREAWGLLSTDARWQPMTQQATADLRDSVGEAFLLGAGGTRLQFGFAALGQLPHTFDLRARNLRAGKLPEGQAPLTTTLPIDRWKNQRPPALRGQALALLDGEFARSLAISPDATGFVLGADWAIRYFSADGSRRWGQLGPGNAWGVNIPQDGPQAGKLVVAAYADGTLRWHRLRDGQELLAFFPHADRKRWVLWTPTGYYDASPGAEDLIGWHVNRGQDQAADFYPASRFRERFWRPDIIDRVLDTLDEGQALAQANEARGLRQSAAPVTVAQVLPPVVDVLSGSDIQARGPQVTLQVQARAAVDAPVTAWRVRVNGETVPDVRGLARQEAAASGNVREITVPVPARDSEIRVFAENRHGVSSAAVVRVAWAGAAPVQAAAPGFQVLPKLYVLAVGVGQYQNPQVAPLGPLPAKDARDFVAAIKRQQGGLYRSVEVKLITDAEATRDNVEEALEWLQKQPTQHDVSMLFVSGHGHNDAAMGYVYLPVNANPDSLKRTAVPWTSFKNTVVAMAGKRLVFMDTCHAGNVMGAQQKAAFNDISGVLSDLAGSENGVVVFSSSTGRQFSLQDPAWGNGAFTKALVEGLNGAAAMGQRQHITHKMLSVYVSERVKELTKGRQSPVNPDPVGVPDFPLAVVR